MNVLAVKKADVNYRDLTDPIVGAPSFLVRPQLKLRLYVNFQNFPVSLPKHLANFFFLKTI